VIHADKDDLIDPDHSRQLFERYGGREKEMRIVPGNHTSRRPTQVVAEAMAFVARAFEAEVPLSRIRQMIGAVEQYIRPFEARIRIIAAEMLSTK
jgi:PhoPQ-activated pathogenicity-related protein